MTSFSPRKAALWMTGAILSFSLMAIAGRELGGHLDTFEVLLYRSAFGILIVLAVGKMCNSLGTIGTDKLRLHFVRNVFHFTGQNLWFYAVTVVPLAQLFAFEFTSPLWVIVLAPIFLKERLSVVKVVAALIGFGGILLIANPQEIVSDPAILAAASSAIFFAGMVMTTKKLTGTQSTTSILFWLVTMHFVFGLVCASLDGNIAVPQGIAIGYVALVGICGLAGHLCITNALKLAPASMVMPFDFLRLPFIAVVGFLLYGEAVSAYFVLGAGMVLGANALIVRSESQKRKLAEHNMQLS